MSQLMTAERGRKSSWRSLNLALVPAERQWLHQRIAQRFNSMLDSGFLDEVTRLRQHYPALTPELPSMRCVGYRQAWAYLDGEYDLQSLVDKGVAATRQLAKRQLTWIRSLDLIALNAQATEIQNQVSVACAAFIAGQPLPDNLAYCSTF
jgi:tRNA dimethylallyltransferase